MADPATIANTQALFGRLAVERGYVSQAQLDMVLRLQQQLGGAHPLGSLFVQRGLMTLNQVQDVIAFQRQIESHIGASARPFGSPPLAAAPPARTPTAPPPPAIQSRRAAAPQAPTQGQAPPRIMTGGPAPVAGGAPMYAPRTAAPPAQAPSTHGGTTGGRSFDPFEDRPATRRAVDPFARAPAEPPPAAPPAHAQASEPLIRTGDRGTSPVVAMIEAAEKRQASDIHFHPGEPPALRVHGVLLLLDQAPLDRSEHERHLLELLSPELRRVFDDAGEIDFAYVSPSGLRTRANIYRTNTGLDATFRLLARGPQTLEELALPTALAKLVTYHQGLVLVTGPAGAGKSTTLAALVNLLNEERSEHILTMEDPIEIVYPQKRALINQRQLGRDTESFARALRGALREDPDVIVIGDLRDRETISLAITAAETGHLVIGSMNTNNAARTVGRLIDAFPPAQQAQVRAQLSESLRGVVSQRLIRTVDGHRLPAIELLFNNSAVGNVIRKGELFQIRSQMQVGKALGMRTLDESLRELVLAGKVDGDEARKHAENPTTIPSTAAPPPQVTPSPQAPQPRSSPFNQRHGTRG